MFFSLPVLMLLFLPASNNIYFTSFKNVHYYTSLLLQTPNTDHCSPLSNQNRQFSLETDLELTDLQATQSPYFRSAQQAVLLEWLTNVFAGHARSTFSFSSARLHWLQEWVNAMLHLLQEWVNARPHWLQDWVNARLHLLHWGVGEREANCADPVPAGRPAFLRGAFSPKPWKRVHCAAESKRKFHLNLLAIIMLLLLLRYHQKVK